MKSGIYILAVQRFNTPLGIRLSPMTDNWQNYIKNYLKYSLDEATMTSNNNTLLFNIYWFLSLWLSIT